jgi:hypothetical protein
MIAFIDRAENPVLFEIFKAYAESRGATIDGDVIAVKGEWAEFTVNGTPARIYNLGFRASAPPTLINLKITKPEGTT